MGFINQLITGGHHIVDFIELAVLEWRKGRSAVETTGFLLQISPQQQFRDGLARQRWEVPKALGLDSHWFPQPGQGLKRNSFGQVFIFLGLTIFNFVFACQGVSRFINHILQSGQSDSNPKRMQ